MMPAFSPAMDSNVSPRNCMWSQPTLVITATSGVTTLVLSSRPPMPVSRTAMSTASSRNHHSAKATPHSKKLACTGSKASRCRSTKSTTTCSGTGFPLIRNLSRKSLRWGEVCNPTFSPASCRMLAIR